MREAILDYTLVPCGLAVMAAYHAWLFHRVVKHPGKTVMGINAIHRRIWVQTMMENPAKNGLLSVQTLRNSIMAATLLATMAIMLSSLVAVLMANSDRGMARVREHGMVYGDKSELGFSVKCFSILLCFLVAFLMNVLSIRYYIHASVLINVPQRSASLPVEFVVRAVNCGSFFLSLGLRGFYFSFPLFLWIFGPFPMLLSCFLLVFLLYFLDVPSSFDWKIIDGPDEDEVAAVAANRTAHTV